MKISPWRLSRMLAVVLALAFLAAVFPRSGYSYPERPKLILALVIDQFRADYLTRFESRFLPSRGKDGTVGGFRYLMTEGAYYPFAEYEILQSMTAPGHATILSGSYPYQAGVPTNYWWDRQKKDKAYCVQDPGFAIVGNDAAKPEAGMSPRTLTGTTLGDELKNAGFPSKVVSLALKDRAAILMGGHRADLTFWFDPSVFQWVSSRFYLPDGKLPAWLSQLNQGLAARKGKKIVWNAEGPGTGYSASDALDFLFPVPKGGKTFPYETTFGTRQSIAMPVMFDVIREAAERAFDDLQLGKGKATDLLAVSISNHDYMGHQFGLNSREMEEMTVAEDRTISQLLNHVRRKLPGGLKDVVVLLTADHGAPSSPEWLKAHRINAGRISESDLSRRIGERLSNRFGKPEQGDWVSFAYDFNFFLNQGAITEKELDPFVVQAEARNAISGVEGIAQAFTAGDVLTRRLPPGMHERQILRTFYPSRSGELVVIPKPFFLPVGDEATHHLTGYTFDRMVPLILAGPGFHRGVRAERANVVDLAPTLAFLLGIVPPALSEGRVLHEALKLR